jgi:undecaprenyl-diphosphatase
MKPDPIKPSRPEIKRRSRLFELLLLVLIMAFAILAYAAKNNPYFPFDLYITRSIQLIQYPWFSNLMLLMTEIGYPFQGTLLTIITPFVLLALKRKHDALILFISTAGAGLLSVILKAIVARPRPDPMLIEQLSSYKVNDSFPSGHVLFFMGFVGYLSYFCYIYFPKGWLRTIAVSFCLLLLILMGMSRIYLGAHWFSDTLGAYLIGTVWLYLVIYFRRRFVDFPSQKSK